MEVIVYSFHYLTVPKGSGGIKAVGDSAHVFGHESVRAGGKTGSKCEEGMLWWGEMSHSVSFRAASGLVWHQSVVAGHKSSSLVLLPDVSIRAHLPEHCRSTVVVVFPNSSQ